MSVRGQEPPAFYAQYVTDVQERIAENASLEFGCLWHIKQTKNTPLSIASDEVSTRIVNLQDAIQASDLYNDVPLRTAVFACDGGSRSERGGGNGRGRGRWWRRPLVGTECAEGGCRF
jgi:hypothetical protein